MVFILFHLALYSLVLFILGKDSLFNKNKKMKRRIGENTSLAITPVQPSTEYLRIPSPYQPQLQSPRSSGTYRVYRE
ncbi:unnamed protein product [Nyctereutes procyonoides]|uniref:(raccoon dog) hypothetical protein n=1 Tax=Nyctereutes procyonoides TaxID=34880 RepID=A0A811YPB3_NYCPR|nr:unnamed protein product [Nyctereutes procyonoides]